jgi:hypothetical protein
MRLILEASANYCRENLLISNEVAVIILDEYSNTGFRDIMLAERGTPNKPPRYFRINLAHAVYIPLYYVLLFPYGNTSWYWGL